MRFQTVHCIDHGKHVRIHHQNTVYFDDYMNETICLLILDSWCMQNGLQRCFFQVLAYFYAATNSNEGLGNWKKLDHQWEMKRRRIKKMCWWFTAKLQKIVNNRTCSGRFASKLKHVRSSKVSNFKGFMFDQHIHVVHQCKFWPTFCHGWCGTCCQFPCRAYQQPTKRKCVSQTHQYRVKICLLRMWCRNPT